MASEIAVTQKELNNQLLSEMKDIKIGQEKTNQSIHKLELAIVSLNGKFVTKDQLISTLKWIVVTMIATGGMIASFLSYTPK